MLHAVFREVLQMSIAASIVISVILIVRLFMKRLPKVFSYALWSIVLLRLLLPFSYELPYRSISMQLIEENSFVQEQEAFVEVEFIEKKVEAIQIKESIYPKIWIIGMSIFILHYFIAYVFLYRRLVASVAYNQDDDIYFADGIQVPFVLGAMNPKIYLPSALKECELEYIILHELHHIKRKDHMIKPLALFTLAVHWFNPFVWLAFYVFSKDMEMSCDEAVLRKLSEEDKKLYLTSLLQLATGKKLFSGTFVAFGEGDTKSRIINAAKWKKPSLLIFLLAVIITIPVAFVGMLIPKNKSYNHPYKWLEQAEFKNFKCEYVDEIVLRDLFYVLKEFDITEFDTYTDYTSEIELELKEKGQTVRLIYGNGVTLFSFEDTIPNGKLWGIEDKDLEYCMKEIRSNRKENIEAANYVEPWSPSREQVYEMRERVLAGVSPEDDYYLTELVKVMNLELESTYLYDGQFVTYEDPNSTSWNYINYGKYRLYVNGVKKRMKNGLLMQDIDEMLAYLDIMEEKHEIDALRSFYYKLHDMDYFLLRYWADEPGYIYDRTTISKYYASLHVYDDIRAE